MLDIIRKLTFEIHAFKTEKKEEIEAFRIKYKGKKGILNALFSSLKTISGCEKKIIGQALNELKEVIENKIDSLHISRDYSTTQDYLNDLTRPGYPLKLGSRHPISIIKNKIVDIFSKIGFTNSDGPEIEDDWHNFTALNLPKHHPARDMQDTFFLEQDRNTLLRTHTSSVQIRYMENNTPPIRILSFGKVFRNESISARSHCIFHQIEGLYVDTAVSFSDLKQSLLYFSEEMFGNSKIRLRPSYFPFTEPSAELDIYLGLATETDHKITKGTGWLEIMGCGIIDPQVLKNVNIDAEKYSGYAFGMGIERIAMFLYQIPDIRMLYENDIRFLEQFRSAS